jgi:hypothetical protein
MSSTAAEGSNPLPDPYDFSLVLGGPLFQLVARARLSGNALELLVRRVIVISLFAWLPLLILSMLGGRAWGDGVRVPFLVDLEVHARFLLALPLLIVAELVVHQRMRPVARQFLERGLIPERSRARFDLAMASAVRLRNSIVAEVMLIALVYLVGALYVWPRFNIGLAVSTWYAVPTGGGQHLSPAGWWLVYVSLPLFQFILFRWYFRLFVWVRFLWQVARCELSLVPTHPDRAGGLGFLSLTVVAFAPVLLAHGVLLSGLIADRIFFHGASLLDFKAQVAVVVVFLLAIVLGPLLLFTPHLGSARRVGLREYGTLAQRYVREFDDKWLRGRAPADEPLVGSADVQSLADLGNSFELVRSMRVVPFTRDTLVQLAVITLLPLVPLLLTMVSLEELLKGLLKVVF